MVIFLIKPRRDGNKRNCGQLTQPPVTRNAFIRLLVMLYGKISTPAYINPCR